MYATKTATKTSLHKVLTGCQDSEVSLEYGNMSRNTVTVET